MYEQFEPTEKRDYTLMVNDGLAYRDTFPDEDADDIQKALDLLADAKSLIKDKTKWIPTTWEHEGGISTALHAVKAVDKHGERVSRPSSTLAVRWTMLGAIESAATRHYTPNSLRIALNAMQLTIESWISLGHNHDDRRIQEQKQAIVEMDSYLDDDMARDGHNRCLSCLDEAVSLLSKEMPTDEDE